MSSSVKIRGSKHGISVKLNSGASYEDIKKDIASEFSEAGKFLGEEKLVNIASNLNMSSSLDSIPSLALGSQEIPLYSNRRLHL